jgi:hypothetical protein
MLGRLEVGPEGVSQSFALITTDVEVFCTTNTYTTLALDLEYER